MADALQQAAEYESSLADLTINSKPLINVLTMLAEENIAIAPLIVQTVEKHLQKVSGDIKLPVLYLIDSILKNVGKEYIALFMQNLVSMFCGAFEKVDEKTRSQMFKLRQTWTDVLPAMKLYELDSRVATIDPAWPVSPPPVHSSSNNRIHLNPKFLNSTTSSPSATLAATPTFSPTPIGTASVTNAPKAGLTEEFLKQQKKLLELEHRKLELELLARKQKQKIAVQLLQQKERAETPGTTPTNDTLMKILPGLALQAETAKIMNAKLVAAAKAAASGDKTISAEQMALLRDALLKKRALEFQTQLAKNQQTSSTGATQMSSVKPVKITGVSTATPVGTTTSTSAVCVPSPSSPSVPVVTKPLAQPQPSQEAVKVKSGAVSVVSSPVNSTVAAKPQTVFVKPVSPSQASRVTISPASSLLINAVQRVRDPRLRKLKEDKPAATPSPAPVHISATATETVTNSIVSSPQRASESVRIKVEAPSSPESPKLEKSEKKHERSKDKEKRRKTKKSSKQSESHPSSPKESPQSEVHETSESVKVEMKEEPALEMLSVPRDVLMQPTPETVVKPVQDVDLRVLPTSPSKKRISDSNSEEPPQKKSKAEMFNMLFGSEDVDLRQLPQAQLPVPVVSLVAPTGITPTPLPIAVVFDNSMTMSTASSSIAASTTTPASRSDLSKATKASSTIPSSSKSTKESSSRTTRTKSKSESKKLTEKPVLSKKAKKLPSPPLSKTPSPPPPPIISTNRDSPLKESTKENSRSWAKYKQVKPDVFKSPYRIPTKRFNPRQDLRSQNSSKLDSVIQHSSPLSYRSELNSAKETRSYLDSQQASTNSYRSSYYTDLKHSNDTSLLGIGERRPKQKPEVKLEPKTEVEPDSDNYEPSESQLLDDRGHDLPSDTYMCTEPPEEPNLRHVKLEPHPEPQSAPNCQPEPQLALNHQPEPHLASNHQSEPHLAPNHQPETQLAPNHQPESHLAPNHQPEPHLAPNHQSESFSPDHQPEPQPSANHQPEPHFTPNHRPEPELKPQVLPPPQPLPPPPPPHPPLLQPPPPLQPVIVPRPMLQQHLQPPIRPERMMIEHQERPRMLVDHPERPPYPCPPGPFGFPPGIRPNMMIRGRHPSARLTSDFQPADPKLLEICAMDGMHTINIDGVPREIRFYGHTAVVFLAADDPREIRFQDGYRNVLFNEEDSIRLKLNDDAVDFELDGKIHKIRLGAPTRELYIDGKGFPLGWNTEPMPILIDGKQHHVQLEGEPPPVTICPEKRLDLVAGKINLVVDGEKLIQIYLDYKPQRFEIDGIPYVLQFKSALQRVIINDRVFMTDFGGKPKPLFLFGFRHFLRLSELPPGIVPGQVNLYGMEDFRPKSPPVPHPPQRLEDGLPPLPSLDHPSQPEQKHFSRHRSKFSHNKHEAAHSAGSGSKHEIEKLSGPSEVLSGSHSRHRRTGASHHSKDASAEERPQTASFLGKSINVNELFEKLVAIGIVGKSNDVKKKEADSSEMKLVDFTKPETLKVRQPAMITKLYSGIQCSTCGLRFPAEFADKYSQHLDWHFRQNRRERDSARTVQSRQWYYDISDWIQFEEIEVLEERAQSWFESQVTDEEGREIPGELLSIPAGSDTAEGVCELCHDPFELFFHEETEEWHFRHAICVDKKLYHPICHQDWLLSLEIEAAEIARRELEEEENRRLEEELKAKEEEARLSKIKEEDEEKEKKAKEESEVKLKAELEKETKSDVEMGTEEQTFAVKEEPMEVTVEDGVGIQVEEGTEVSEEGKPIETLVEQMEINEAVSQEIVIADIEIKKEDSDMTVVPDSQVDSTYTGVTSSIDGNVELAEPSQVAVGAANKIKINISKPVFSPPVKEEVVTTEPAAEEPELISESTAGVTIDPNEPFPPGLEPEQPVVKLKPRLVGRKLTEYPPISKGTELSGLCSIM